MYKCFGSIRKLETWVNWKPGLWLVHQACFPIDLCFQKHLCFQNTCTWSGPTFIKNSCTLCFILIITYYISKQQQVMIQKTISLSPFPQSSLFCKNHRGNRQPNPLGYSPQLPYFSSYSGRPTRMVPYTTMVDFALLHIAGTTISLCYCTLSITNKSI